MRYVLFLFLFLVTMLTCVNAQGGIIDEILSPLEFDAHALYEAHSGLIDFVLASVLFIALSYVSIGRKFSGRPGKSLSAALGIALAFGFISAEAKLGFNLSSLSPVAMFIVSLLIAGILYFTVVSIGGAHSTSFSVSYLLFYSILQVTSPSLFDFLKNRIPVVNSIVLLLLLVSVGYLLYRAVKVFWREPSFNKIGKGLKGAAEWFQQKPVLKKEKEEITGKLEPLSKEIYSDIKKSLKTEKQLEKVIEECRDSPEKLLEISRQIQPVFKNKIAKIQQRLEYMKGLVDRLKKLDLRVFSNLKSQVENLPKEQKKQAKSQIHNEMKKISAEDRMIRLEKELTHYKEGIKTAVSKLQKALKSGNADIALRWLKKIEAMDNKARDVLIQQEALERQINRITTKELEVGK